MIQLEPRLAPATITDDFVCRTIGQALVDIRDEHIEHVWLYSFRSTQCDLPGALDLVSGPLSQHGHRIVRQAELIRSSAAEIQLGFTASDSVVYVTTGQVTSE